MAFSLLYNSMLYSRSYALFNFGDGKNFTAHFLSWISLHSWLNDDFPTKHASEGLWWRSFLGLNLAASRQEDDQRFWQCCSRVRWVGRHRVQICSTEDLSGSKCLQVNVSLSGRRPRLCLRPSTSGTSSRSDRDLTIVQGFHEKIAL